MAAAEAFRLPPGGLAVAERFTVRATSPLRERALPRIQPRNAATLRALCHPPVGACPPLPGQPAAIAAAAACAWPPLTLAPPRRLRLRLAAQAISRELVDVTHARGLWVLPIVQQSERQARSAVQTSSRARRPLPAPTAPPVLRRTRQSRSA